MMTFSSVFPKIVVARWQHGHSLLQHGLLLFFFGFSAEGWSQEYALRFQGAPLSNVNRVTVQLDPAVPADIGATDFTLEFWMKSNASQNTSNGGCSSGTNSDNWITGNIIFDRAIWEHDLNGDFGLSMFSNGSTGRLAFGLYKEQPIGSIGLCGTQNVADGQWHHVAVTRVASTGLIRIWVDGQLDVAGTGPSGDVSYRNGQPSSVPSYINLNVDNYLGIGAEKYDADPARYPSFNGWLDEVRLSNVVRYTAAFTPPTAPFAADSGTLALYHFNEGLSSCGTTPVVDSAPGAASPGVRRCGGSAAGPTYVTDTPFAAGPNPGTVQFERSSDTVSEAGGAAQVTVTRSGGSGGAATVAYAVSGGTATAGQDYTTPAGTTLQWADGQSATQAITVPILEDTVVEGSETVQITLSSFTGAIAGSNSVHTLTISDNDSAGSLQFAAASYAVTEGGPVPAIVVTRTGGSSGSVSVSYATQNGTAVAGSDYAASSGTLTFAHGVTSQTLPTVAVLDDAAPEAFEQFSLNLSGVSGGASLGAPAGATVQIADNDAAGSLQFSVANQSVAESAGAATLTVTRVGGSAGAVGASFATEAVTAAAGADFTTTLGSLQFAAGETTRTITVPIAADSLQETNETLTVRLSSPTGFASLGTPNPVTLTIVDDDAPSGLPGTLAFSASTATGGEGATVTLSVQRSGGSTGAVGVAFQTQNGTAVAPGDFAVATGTLNWASGDGSAKSISIALAQDTAVEGVESFNVVLSAATGGATLGTATSAMITIQDDDVAQPGTLQLSAPSYSVTEGAFATISISRGGGSDGAVSATVTSTSGSAASGTDFSPASQLVSFATGESGTKSISIGTVDDSSSESAESFTVTLQNPAGGAALGSPSSATVTIVDNDAPASSGGGGRLGLELLGLAGLLQFGMARRRRPVIQVP